MALETYKEKRDFAKTPEPAPRKVSGKPKQGYSFCVQKHDATRLHYDFRLELDGVLLSWAVTKGPSLNPSDKRLAVRTEDHPLDYGDFEGTIPKGQYGGGTVMLWDRGRWNPLDDPHKGLKKGHIAFELEGERLKGKWALIRMHGKDNDKRENWLLIKENDEEASEGKKAERFLDKTASSVKTGRPMDAIAAGTYEWQSGRKIKKKKPGLTVAKLMETYPEVQLATLVSGPPAGKDWIHEIKFDGYRILCFVANGNVRIVTRNGHDWTGRFPAIAASLSALTVDSAVLDGEAVMLDDRGQSGFQALQAALSEDGKAGDIRAYLFDCLHLDGDDISGLPLRDRKARLKNLVKLSKKSPALLYSDDMDSQDSMLSKACEIGLEGLISKRADAPYRAGRGKDWLKSKCGKRQEFVIVGYAPAKSGGRAIGALHLAYTKDGGLHYAGKVGTGFTMKSAKQIYDRLAPLQVDAPPIQDIPRAARRGSFWVQPYLLCEVSFTEWTADGHIRHPSFEGLREDKEAGEVVQEKPVKTKKVAAKTMEKAGNLEIAGIVITHPEREIFPDTHVTKGDLARYYEAVAPFMMADLARRPISLIRCPSGTGHECFFQRNPDNHMKKYVKPFIWEHKGKKHEYLYIEDQQGLIFLIQMGVIEIHPWGATVDAIEHPTRMIFDLDADEGIPFEAVKLAAFDVRERLKVLGLDSTVKCTGGKGLHVVVPLDGKAEWPDVKHFAGSFAEHLAREAPDAYVATMTKSKRKGKIFVDYFRNDYTATAVADYAVRARPGAPVAVPLSWKELKTLKSANEFTMQDVIRRLKGKNPDSDDKSIQTLPKPVFE